MTQAPGEGTHKGSTYASCQPGPAVDQRQDIGSSAFNLHAQLPAHPGLERSSSQRTSAPSVQGKLPAGGEGDPATQRAYLSNVCVASAARRRGLAAQLIQAALAGAREQGVAHMYVHVVHDNEAALKLYKQVMIV